MLPKNARREEVLERLEEAGGLRPGAVEKVHRQTGVPEADVYGVATFYHLLAEPDAGVRVCQGLSCKLAGCDAFDGRSRGPGQSRRATSRASDAAISRRRCGTPRPKSPPPAHRPRRPATRTSPSTSRPPRTSATGQLARALDEGPDWVLDELEASGLHRPRWRRLPGAHQVAGDPQAGRVASATWCSTPTRASPAPSRTAR